MLKPTLHQAIEGHSNNYTWLRLLLSASIIYYHSFALVSQSNYADQLTYWLQPVTTVGGLAVQSFFFLSGLFVAQSYHRDPSFVHFFIKRFLRIWPGLFVCVSITTLVAAGASQFSENTHDINFKEISDYILKTSIFEFKWTVDGIYSENKLSVLNGSIHTLPLEAKMYVLLGVVGLVGMVKSTARIWISGALLFGLCFVPGTLDRLPLHLFNADYSRAAICMFLAGMVAFGFSKSFRPAFWHGAALIFLAVCTKGVWHTLAFYAVVCWILLYLGQDHGLLPWGSPRQDLSYGIYLYGWPSQQLIMSQFPELNPYQLAISALFLAGLWAFLSWHIVEKPAIQLGKVICQKPLRLRILSSFPFNSFVFVLMLLGSVVVVFRLRGLTPSLDSLPNVPMAISIERFGPTESRAGQSINLQADGSSAIWLETSGVAPAKAVIVMDDQPLETTVQRNLVTAKVPERLLVHAGDKKIQLINRLSDHVERSQSVVMKITP